MTERPITIPPGLSPTPPQWHYVRDLQRRLHLTDALLESHCLARWNELPANLDRAQVSELIDEMLGWDQMPAQLRREAGQRDLPGFGNG